MIHTNSQTEEKECHAKAEQSLQDLQSTKQALERDQEAMVEKNSADCCNGCACVSSDCLRAPLRRVGAVFVELYKVR